jgi:hypothetical protein
MACHVTNQIDGIPMLCQMCACLRDNLCARTTVDAEVEGLSTEGIHRVVYSDLAYVCVKVDPVSKSNTKSWFPLPKSWIACRLFNE